MNLNNINLNDIQFYIAHYPKLIDRKKYIIKKFEENNLKNYIFLEHDNKEQVENKHFLKEIHFNFEKQNIIDRINGFIDLTTINQFISDGLNSAEMSLALKHKFSYEHFLLYSDKKYFCFFEDDIIFYKNFCDLLIQFLNDLNDNFDIFLFGAGAAIKGKKIDEVFSINQNYKNNFYNLNKHPFGRGCDSYLIKKDVIKNLHLYFNSTKICCPIDWELSKFSMSSNLKVVASTWNLTLQGSACEVYASSIRDRGENY